MSLLTALADFVGLTQYRAWYWVPSKDDGSGWDEVSTEWYFSEQALDSERRENWLPDSFSRIEVKNG